MTECLTDHPCGCDLLEKAKTTKDKRVRERYQTDGEHFQRAWKCPRRERIPPRETAELPKEAQDALSAVKDLTGAEELQTCPLFYARLDWVGDVVRLRRWFQKGQLHLRNPYPSGVLVDAIDCVEDSVAMREAWELERIQAQADSAQTRPPGTPTQPGPPKS